MRRQLLWAWLICLAASRAWAQTDTLVGIRAGSIELGAAGGLSAPVGDYGDLASLSGTGAVILGYYPGPHFSFGIDMGVHWHGVTDLADSLQAASLGQTTSDLSFKLYRIFTPYAKFQLTVARVSPYLTGLAGFYLQEARWTYNTLTASVTQTASQGYFGLATGVGVQIVSDDNVLVFLEGRLHNAMRSGSAPLQFIDARVGLTFLL